MPWRSALRLYMSANSSAGLTSPGLHLGGGGGGVRLNMIPRKAQIILRYVSCGGEGGQTLILQNLPSSLNPML